MKTLNFNGVQYEAERIIKTTDSIVGYVGDAVTFKFSGVTDFNGFTFENGQEFDEQEQSEVEILKEQVSMQQALIDELLFDILPNLITDEEVV